MGYKRASRWCNCSVLDSFDTWVQRGADVWCSNVVDLVRRTLVRSHTLLSLSTFSTALLAVCGLHVDLTVLYRTDVYTVIAMTSFLPVIHSTVVLGFWNVRTFLSVWDLFISVCRRPKGLRRRGSVGEDLRGWLNTLPQITWDVAGGGLTGSMYPTSQTIAVRINLTEGLNG